MFDHDNHHWLIFPGIAIPLLIYYAYKQYTRPPETLEEHPPLDDCASIPLNSISNDRLFMHYHSLDQIPPEDENFIEPSSHNLQTPSKDERSTISKLTPSSMMSSPSPSSPSTKQYRPIDIPDSELSPTKLIHLYNKDDVCLYLQGRKINKPSTINQIRAQYIQRIDHFLRNRRDFYAPGYCYNINKLRDIVPPPHELRLTNRYDFIHFLRIHSEFRMPSDQKTFELTALTPYQIEGKRVYGYFNCVDQYCHMRWESNDSYANIAENCPKCHARVYPFRQRYLTSQDPLPDHITIYSQEQAYQQAMMKGHQPRSQLMNSSSDIDDLVSVITMNTLTDMETESLHKSYSLDYNNSNDNLVNNSGYSTPNNLSTHSMDAALAHHSHHHPINTSFNTPHSLMNKLPVTPPSVTDSSGFNSTPSNKKITNSLLHSSPLYTTSSSYVPHNRRLTTPVLASYPQPISSNSIPSSSKSVQSSTQPEKKELDSNSNNNNDNIIQEESEFIKSSGLEETSGNNEASGIIETSGLSKIKATPSEIIKKPTNGVMQTPDRRHSSDNFYSTPRKNSSPKRRTSSDRSISTNSTMFLPDNNTTNSTIPLTIPSTLTTPMSNPLPRAPKQPFK